jgi:hypothetical protein
MTAPTPPTVKRVISGGQTGADRGGLDAAIDLGLPMAASVRRVGSPKTESFRSATNSRRPRAPSTRSGRERTSKRPVRPSCSPTGRPRVAARSPSRTRRLWPFLAIDLNASSAFGALTFARSLAPAIALSSSCPHLLASDEKLGASRWRRGARETSGAAANIERLGIGRPRMLLPLPAHAGAQSERPPSPHATASAIGVTPSSTKRT